MEDFIVDIFAFVIKIDADWVGGFKVIYTWLKLRIINSSFRYQIRL